MAAGRTLWRIQGNAVWFGFGCILFYGITNPDRKNFYEIMPVYRQRYYAIIAKFTVDYADHKDFEFFTKDVIRYYQQHQGYLFSTFIRSRDRSSQTIDYYLIQTWATMGAFKRAFDTPYREELTRAARPLNVYSPQVLKIVADDFEYVPPPTQKDANLERTGVRRATGQDGEGPYKVAPVWSHENRRFL